MILSCFGEELVIVDQFRAGNIAVAEAFTEVVPEAGAEYGVELVADAVYEAN